MGHGFPVDGLLGLPQFLHPRSLSTWGELQVALDCAPVNCALGIEDAAAIHHHTPNSPDS